MASTERIKDLKDYCEQWRESAQNLTKRLDELVVWQSSGMQIFENGNTEDILQMMIVQADAAASNVNAIFIRMQALHNRAVAGEDV